MLKIWQQFTESDSIITVQMAYLGCLSVLTFGNFLLPVLVSAPTVNDFDLKKVDKGLIKDWSWRLWKSLNRFRKIVGTTNFACTAYTGPQGDTEIQNYRKASGGIVAYRLLICLPKYLC